MKIRKTIVILLTILCLFLGLNNLVFADYIHGHFRYIVSDESVTITGYYGDESVVTVPAMIGGNPVNTIASGAFAGSSVTAVYLPDTIMSIEGGAFGPGQSVVYNSFSMTASETGTPGEDTTGTGETTDPSEIPTSSGPVGIWDDQGNLITTDDQGNLLLVDPTGNETVLDDTQDYKVDQDDQGNVTIRTEGGGEVTVHDGSTVEFQDVEGRFISTNTATGSMTISDPNSGVAYEVADIDLEDESAPEQTSPVKTEVETKAEAIEEPESSTEQETPTEAESEAEERTTEETETSAEKTKQESVDEIVTDEAETESKAEPESPDETEILTEEETMTETVSAEETQAPEEAATESDAENDTTRVILWPIIIAGLVIIIVVIILIMRKRSRR